MPISFGNRMSSYFRVSGDRIIMDTPEHYRAYAEECLGWARTAKTDREREIFIEMARTWLKAAARFEGDVPWMIAPFRPAPDDSENSAA
jgi:hypothetical protein